MLFARRSAPSRVAASGTARQLRAMIPIPRVEAMLRDKLRRGTISVAVRVTRTKSCEDYRIDTELLDRYYESFQQWQESRGLDRQVRLDNLLLLPGVVNEELASTQSRLSLVKLEKLSSRQTELEGQLSQATSQFEAVKAMLSQPIGSIAVTSILFNVARANGVEVTKMTSSGLASDSLEGVTCSVISLSAKVEGDVPNLVNFVTKLNSLFTTGVVKSITITIPETASEEKASADIQLVVYTYQDR